MNLEELKDKILEQYSYSWFYKKYFEIGTNSKYFHFKRISIIFSTFIFFFIISYVFTLPKLENESLYIFAAQVTIIALIFPIILTLIGILYSKKNDFDSIFQIYISNTNAKTLYRGSFITLLFYVISFFYLYDSSTSEKIRVALNATLAITFIDTIIISLFFLEKTISFTTAIGLNKTLKKHYVNNKTDDSINILSIISNRINENIKDNDLNSYEKNLDFLIELIDMIIIMSSKIENDEITSDLHKIYNNEIFSTKFSKIISLIQKNIENSIQHSNSDYYHSIKSIYFYIFSKNYKNLEVQTMIRLLEAHQRQCYFLDTKKCLENPKLINDFISSWYKWINPYQNIEQNLLFLIFKNHLRLTTEIIDIFSKSKNLRGLDYFCDCLSRWESEAKDMPNYLEPQNYLQTVIDDETPQSLANLTIETKLIAFYLIQKQEYDISLIYKYYKILIKGHLLFKTTDLRENSYSFENLDDIIFSYLRLLSNRKYDFYFNDFLENSDRTIEIAGLMYGGLIPNLESRISQTYIKLLLLNTTSNQSLSYAWKEAIQSISLAQINKIKDLIQKITKSINNYNNHTFLQWNTKKLNVTKTRLICYLYKIMDLLDKEIKIKFQFIQLDEVKVKNLTYENTLHIKTLKDVFKNSSFSNHLSFSNLSYEDNVKISSLSKIYPSKYLTKDYDIHLDSIFKTAYYTFIIDNIIFKKINKIKRTEHLIVSSGFHKLQKIYLRSCIFATPIVIFNDPDLLEFISHNHYQKLSFPYLIQKMENNQHYKIGKSIFKYVSILPKNSAYILPQHIIKNVYFNAITPNTLSKVDIKIDSTNHENASVNVEFPFEVHLNENSVVLEIFIKKLRKL